MLERCLKKKTKARKKKPLFPPFDSSLGRNYSLSFFFPHARIVVVGQTNKQEKKKDSSALMLPFAGERKREKTAQTRPAVSQREVWKEKKAWLDSTSHRHTWKKKVAQKTAHEREKKNAALAKAIDHPPLFSADIRFGRQFCFYFEQVPRRKLPSLSFRVSKLRCKLSRHSWLIRRGKRFELIKR